MVRERKKRIYRKRIPYGMQNFEDVIKEDCYYVDKTPFIEDIEDSNMYFFFLRPRRFGIMPELWNLMEMCTVATILYFLSINLETYTPNL